MERGLQHVGLPELASLLGLTPSVLLTAMIGSGLRTELGPGALILVVGGVLGLLGLAALGVRWRP